MQLSFSLERVLIFCNFSMTESIQEKTCRYFLKFCPRIQFSQGGSSSGGGSGGGKKDVIELTDSNFDELVLQSEDLWLVEFYAPW